MGGRQRQQRPRRVAEARGCRKGWTAWVSAVAAELDAIGERSRAARLRGCGRKSLAAHCVCGATHAHPLISCGLRVCPWCARRDAARRAERLAAAMAQLAREHPRKRWRFVTLTGPWDPADPDQVSVRGLRERVSKLWAKWSRIWPELRRRCGVVAATAACESSDRGHVHLHIAVLSGWIDPGWLAGLWGAHVDVRAITQRGHKEIAKYLAKTHSPADLQWVAGKHRRTIHPRLAARWESATAGRQMRRSYGQLRGLVGDGDLLAADTDPADADVRRCDACGLPLPPREAWQLTDTVTLARRVIRATSRIYWHFWPPV